MRLLLLETIVAMVVDARDSEGFTALHLAAAGGHACLEIVTLLLEEGLATVDARGGGLDSTPLHTAAERGHDAVARVLLEHGAVIGAKGVGSLTALHVAAAHGHLETVRVLLDYGARFDVLSFLGYTPVDMAMVKGHMDVLQLMLNAGAMVVLAMNVLGLRIDRRMYMEDEVIFTEACLPPQIAGSHRRPGPGDDEDDEDDEDAITPA